MSTRLRSYSSPRRTEQAAETRRKIAASARKLFVSRGFAGTTIEMIADGAGVAVPTVYSTYGSKRAILLQLFADIVAKESLQTDLATEDDPRRQLRLIVDFDVRLFTQGADLFAAVRNAGPHDRALERLRIEGENRRRKGLASVVRAWSQKGALRSGLSEEEALDVMWAMTSDLFYTLFVRGNRWPVERYKAWLAVTLESLILRK
jgi:AcrR family transcriptional regulator